MSKKNWLNPEIIKLGLESTEDPRDWLYFWKCKECENKYFSLWEPTFACNKCGSIAWDRCMNEYVGTSVTTYDIDYSVLQVTTSSIL